MRIVRVLSVIALLATGLAACATSPREPAPVSMRTPNAYPGGSVACSGGGYTVRRGDTLSEIAQACGVSMRQIAADNGLSAPYALRTGQVLRLPAPAVHVVQRGENLYRIGLRYGLDYRELGAFNGIRAPYEIEVGDTIRLPDGSTARSASNTTRPAATTRRAPDRPAPPPASSGAPSFDWPIRGEILSDFGPKPNGRRNDGINIRASAGAQVRAAAPGQVVYAGDELPGYGQLILVRHENGFVTAYAHNRRLLVDEGRQVARGEVIAEAGASGSVESPQVHFEIRRGTRPENPMSYLR